MKKLLALACTAAVMAVPGVASAQGEPTESDKQQAQRTCKQLRAAAGKQAFAQMYGKKGIGHCIKKETRENAAERQQAAEQAQQNAAQQCRAEREDPNFAAGHGGKSFDQFYGTNRNGKNAFGKCVSQKAQEQNEQQS